jgi:branched-chain amino acid transport system permease protein
MESYEADQKWWRTRFIKGKMLLMIVLLVAFPFLVDKQWLSVAYTINYYILAALGVQLLIGYCGQVTLGHAAFVAVGGYCSCLMVMFLPWPEVLRHAGLAYPISMICAGLLAGVWSVLFGLPSARVKGFYLILTTMAAQWITVDLIIQQYVSQVGGRLQSFSIPTEALKVGPWLLKEPSEIGTWTLESDAKIYYLSVVVVAICLLATGNLLRSKFGRAWVAIRDNDIAAETMGVNIVWYKLIAFFVAGFFGGIAGAFHISTLSFVSPENYPWTYSLIWVGVILIGGVGSIQGLVFGSIFVVGVFKLLELGAGLVNIHLVEYYPQLEWLTMKVDILKDVTFGLAIILFLMYEPNGLSYRYWQLKNYFNLWPFSYQAK